MGEAKRRHPNENLRCYRTKVWFRGKEIKLLVWNGVEDYINMPSDSLIETMGGGVVIIQISQENQYSIAKIIDKYHCDSLILWCKNTEIYRDGVDFLTATARKHQGRESTYEEKERNDWLRTPRSDH